MQDTMSHIFLVILTIGYNCCDRVQRTLRGFSDKRDAESYMSEMRHRISYNMGLRHAVDRLMSDTWDKVNPAPTCPDPDYNDRDRSINTYNDYCAASDAHNEARRKEVDRLLALVGWRADIDTAWEEEYDLHIQEVPFGFEVVKPAEEEQVAQAAE